MFPKTARFLLVDDLASLLSDLKHVLTSLGYKEFETAKNGKEAYQKLTDLKNNGVQIDCVISDLHMPQMDGIELLKNVRKTYDAKSLPFILLTTDSEQSKVIEAVNAGANNYIVKPVAEKIMKEKLEAVWSKMQ